MLQAGGTFFVVFFTPPFILYCIVFGLVHFGAYFHPHSQVTKSSNCHQLACALILIVFFCLPLHFYCLELFYHEYSPISLHLNNGFTSIISTCQRPPKEGFWCEYCLYDNFVRNDQHLHNLFSGFTVSRLVIVLCEHISKNAFFENDGVTLRSSPWASQSP